MSRYGSILVECDNHNCHGTENVTPDDFADTRCLDSLLEDSGWRVIDGKDICPQCVEEANPRERGDDDGVEYADPRDRRDGRE